MRNIGTQQKFGIADLHMHTTVSDGTMSPQAVVNEIIIHNILNQRRGGHYRINVIAITDHDSIQGGLVAQDYLRNYYDDADLEIIVGAEISSFHGHILGLNLKKNIAPGMPALDTIEAIREQGGIAIAAHPFAYIPLLKGLKGIGRLICDKSVAAKLDAIEIRNANPTETLNNYITEFVNFIFFRKPVCGGSDSHFQSAITKTYTAFPGSTAQDLYAALRAGTTRAHGYVYGPFSIYRYVRDRLAWKQFCLQDPVHRVFHDW